MDPLGVAAALRVRVSELEQEADALRSELRACKPGQAVERVDSNGAASPSYPSFITSFKLASSDALREKLHALMAEGRLKVSPSLALHTSASLKRTAVWRQRAGVQE